MDEKLLQEILNLQDEVIANQESDELEFKSAKGGFPGSFWETYSAFANTTGGTIILGIKEKNNVFSLDHLSEDVVIKYKKQFWNDVNNKSTVNHNICQLNDVREFEIQGNWILIFHIPSAHYEDRPVYHGQNPYDGTFKRNYEGDYKCTNKEVQRMFADADSRVSADMRILQNYTMEDIDFESLRQYRQLFKTENNNHPWTQLGDMEFLVKLGAYRKDRATHREGFTVAGLLMFGKYESIIDPECVPDFYPDYQEILEEGTRWTHRIYPDGMWETNLFQFYTRVMPRLLSALPKPFKLNRNLTRVEEMPAHIAVREAFITPVFTRTIQLMLL